MRARKNGDAAEEKVANKTTITPQWVMEKLAAIAERAMEPVAVVDRNGVPTGEYRCELSVANKALELLGKELGMFRDAKRREQASTPEDLPNWSDNEIARRMALILTKKGPSLYPGSMSAESADQAARQLALIMRRPDDPPNEVTRLIDSILADKSDLDGGKTLEVDDR
jgi:hypothetical protein